MGKLFEIIAKIRVWGISGIRCYVKDRMLYRRAARRLAKNAAEFPCEDSERGITVIGNFTGASSNCKTNRDFIHSLKDAGIPCQAFDIGDRPMIPEKDYADVVTPEKDFRLNRYSHVVEMFRSPLPRHLVKNRARIAFWEGEHGILAVWPFLGGSDPVIGMSDFNVEYFRKDLKEAKVYKILYPLRKVDVNLISAKTIRGRFGLGENDFVVFFNFDFGSFHRKNPQATIRAFARAFAGIDSSAAVQPHLVFKTMGAKAHTDQLAELKTLAESLGIGARFKVITEYLPHDELYSLTAACDVYVSLHRGEGFGIGMAEAMLFAKPVVATNWSANTEFTREGVSIPVPYKRVPVKPGEYFECMKEWAEADVDAAAAALRKLYDEPDFRREIGFRAKAFIEDHFAIENFRKSVEAFLDGETVV